MRIASTSSTSNSDSRLSWSVLKSIRDLSISTRYSVVTPQHWTTWTKGPMMSRFFDQLHPPPICFPSLRTHVMVEHILQPLLRVRPFKGNLRPTQREKERRCQLPTGVTAKHAGLANARGLLFPAPRGDICHQLSQEHGDATHRDPMGTWPPLSDRPFKLHPQGSLCVANESPNSLFYEQSQAIGRE